MLKTVKTYKDCPFEEGKIYQTRFATTDTFLLKEIIWKEFKLEGVTQKRMILFKGIFQEHKHLGICPLNVDRLIPETVESGEIEVCGKCGEPK